jgi:hypothetical protein
MKTTALLLIVMILLPIAKATGGQLQPLVTKRLRNPASVRGFIGGESHQEYVIHVRRGRVLTVRLSWRREADNRAEFSVKESRNSEPSKFGMESDDGKRWTGKIPKSGDYYIDVYAHPTAHYTLRVAVR